MASFADGIRSDWRNGNYGEAVGRGLFEAVSSLLSGGIVAKIAGPEIATVVGRLAERVSVLGTALRAAGSRLSTFATALRGAEKVTPDARLLDDLSDGASTARVVSRAKGWRLGDAIDAPTARGKASAWSNVRGRHWKNRAAGPGAGLDFSADNIARMRKGLAPLEDEFGIGVPMELNHIVPRRLGGGHNIENLEELWPWQHDLVDAYRHYTGPRPPQ